MERGPRRDRHVPSTAISDGMLEVCGHCSPPRIRLHWRERVGHNITAIVIADAFKSEVASNLDLAAVPLTSPLTLFHIDHYYTAYWQTVRRRTHQLDVPSGFPGV